MPQIADIMSTDVRTIEPQASLKDAARLMQELDVGSLPVCNGRELVGIITDRDIAIRGVAAGLAPESGRVSDVMSDEVQWCTVDQDAEEAMRLMGDAQVRRVPVIDMDKNLVGIVSLGDVATRQPGHIDKTVREISEPGESITPPRM